jgi:nitrogen fixation-related uncharacterized protein
VTITLGWKHALVAALVVVALAIGFTWALKNAQRRDVLDAERVALIDQLEDERDGYKDEADIAKAEADELRDGLVEITKPIDRGRAALDHAKTHPLPKVMEMMILREQNVLLEQALALSEKQSLALRRSLTLTGMALDASEERYDLLNKRYSSLKRTQKKTKRRNIWTSVTVASAGLMVGFGIGRL